MSDSLSTIKKTLTWAKLVLEEVKIIMSDPTRMRAANSVTQRNVDEASQSVSEVLLDQDTLERVSHQVDYRSLVNKLKASANPITDDDLDGEL